MYKIFIALSIPTYTEIYIYIYRIDNTIALSSLQQIIAVPSPNKILDSDFSTSLKTYSSSYRYDKLNESVASSYLSLGFISLSLSLSLHLFLVIQLFHTSRIDRLRCVLALFAVDQKVHCTNSLNAKVVRFS